MGLRPRADASVPLEGGVERPFGRCGASRAGCVQASRFPSARRRARGVQIALRATRGVRCVGAARAPRPPARARPRADRSSAARRTVPPFDTSPPRRPLPRTPPRTPRPRRGCLDRTSARSTPSEKRPRTEAARPGSTASSCPSPR